MGDKIKWGHSEPWVKLVQWLVSIIPALGRLRQIDPHEFEAILDYIVSGQLQGETLVSERQQQE